MASDVILKEDVVIHRDRRLTITHLGVAMQWAWKCTNVYVDHRDAKGKTAYVITRPYRLMKTSTQQ